MTIKKTDKAPPQRQETARQEIIALLQTQQDYLTAKDISGFVRISEKEVYDHLEHISHSLDKKTKGQGLTIKPAECSICGFVFKKREKLKKPGKCPICKNEKIAPPQFKIAE
ncbi:ribbon transcriptional regulator [Candidatus Magnetoovum chiemensis]|nr:ribbon transcriptional regulator [Candidatus Magnetoovum chiemensis]